MPDLLLELFSEEIPARMQKQASDDLKRLVTNALVERGLIYEGAIALATPRRLALHIAGLPTRSADVREEKRGPRVGSPDAALQGFLRAAGLSSIDQAKIEPDPKGKGEFYVAVIEKSGAATLDVLAEILPPIIRTFPWPKSIRWGAASTRSDALRWVRPLHSIVATFGPETEDPDVVPFDVDGIVAGDVTFGHRFMAPDAIRVRRFDDYAPALEKAKVVLDPERRKQIILADAKDLALAQGLELVEDEGLLDEVAGLVEWPVVLMGEFEEAFLDIPAEVIRATIRANQKCFVLRGADGKLANKFILVSNVIASDGGKAIAAGNARVVRARLSDALYFWKTDQGPLPDYVNDDNRAKPLDQRLAKLRALNIVFHEKLGTQGERVQRIMALAKKIAQPAGADPELAERAAELAKADLTTEVVGEFPETQGLMGRRYAQLQGEHADVCAAIEEHYKPLGPSDRTPTNAVSVAVALADKVDTLFGFWSINEKPTGSKDPFALRRAALGVNALQLQNDLRLNIRPLAEAWFKERGLVYLQFADIIDNLLNFLEDRYIVQKRQAGSRHDIVEAVLASLSLVPGNPLVTVDKCVEALGSFLDTDDGKNLLAGYKRAVNIVRAEEKKEKGADFGVSYEPSAFVLDEERALAATLEAAKAEAASAVAREDFAAAMTALSKLRAPVDAFFDKVTVNDADPAKRRNRLALLNALRGAVHTVADFSKISG